MSDKRHFILRDEPHPSRKLAAAACMTMPAGYHVTIQEESRTLAQNSKLWPMLQEVSAQVDWYGQKLTEEEWKDVFSAALKKQKVVPGLDGGFVVCGQRTSKMGKKDFSELIELITAFGVQHGVMFHDEKVE